MIVRILSEGQWELSDDAVRRLNELDEAVEQAVAADDQERLGQALQSLHDRVRATGTPSPTMRSRTPISSCRRPTPPLRTCDGC